MRQALCADEELEGELVEVLLEVSEAKGVEVGAAGHVVEVRACLAAEPADGPILGATAVGAQRARGHLSRFVFLIVP